MNWFMLLDSLTCWSEYTHIEVIYFCLTEVLKEFKTGIGSQMRKYIEPFFALDCYGWCYKGCQKKKVKICYWGWITQVSELLYADEMMIIPDSVENLQHNLNLVMSKKMINMIKCRKDQNNDILS